MSDEPVKNFECLITSSHGQGQGYPERSRPFIINLPVDTVWIHNKIQVEEVTKECEDIM